MKLIMMFVFVSITAQMCSESVVAPCDLKREDIKVGVPYEVPGCVIARLDAPPAMNTSPWPIKLGVYSIRDDQGYTVRGPLKDMQTLLLREIQKCYK
jgi:hypothetical protein